MNYGERVVFNGHHSYEVEYQHGMHRDNSRSRSCFVATVAYGDVNAPEVQVLRDFRDSVLMESGLGRKVVALYYSGLGEKTAHFIQHHIPSTIPIIKKGLDYLVKRYQSEKEKG